MSFGKSLSRILKEKKIKQRDASAALKVSPKTLQEWVSGRFPRNPEHLKRLAEYLGVSVHYLMFGTEEKRDLVKDLFEKNEVHTGVYEITIKKLNPKKQEN